MRATVRYLLADYLRSWRFVAPGVLLVAGVIVAYAQPPNPVLSTAASVIPLLFAAQCWLTLAFFNSQGSPDRHVLAATVGGRRFVLGRLLAAGAIAAIAAVVTVAIPFAGRRFAHPPTAGELAVILLTNLIAALGATALAALFARPLIYSRVVSVLGLAVCAVLTVPLHLPGSAVPTAQALDAAHAAHVPGRLAGDVVSLLVFTAAVGAVCARAWRRRD